MILLGVLQIGFTAREPRIRCQRGRSFDHHCSNGSIYCTDFQNMPFVIDIE